MKRAPLKISKNMAHLKVFFVAGRLGVGSGSIGVGGLRVVPGGHGVRGGSRDVRFGGACGEKDLRNDNQKRHEAT